MNAHDCRKIFREKRKNGQIEVPSSCSKCNRDDLPIKPFFEDYDKPEQITWLCTECFKSFDKARPNPFKGKKHSLESRLSMSDLGYFKENVVPCCKTCNFMKLRLSQEDFVKHIQKIANNLSNLK